MKKSIQKTIDLAYSLFDSAYAERDGYQTFHFATLCRRNKILAVGQNKVREPSPKAVYFANKFGTPKKRAFPFICAEVDCISKLWGRVQIDSSLTMVVVRLNKDGEFRMSKPCISCTKVLESLGINNVYWTTESGVNCE